MVGNPSQPKRFDQATRDELDRVLAAHYEFTDKELDFIPSASLRAGNYDIRYRTGREEETAEA